MKKIDCCLLFKLEFIANAGTGVDQYRYRQGLIGFTGKVCNFLYLVVLINPEIFFIEIGYQLTLFVSDRTGDIYQFNINPESLLGSIQFGLGTYGRLRKIGGGR